ncbi:hypothetical protein N7466_002197 [Penicillium verhagenii]|uniref:uncharacterized protein n=1 Tax=Penicillium verhagenii TaxID=1562060 RepID=UPI002544F5A6|nr:uncharacterized protein N7466_002197 [Penicillium verhagenii]KAJ5939063.1 hypothetical protein N7466_002197 [Penicillium verhagenii]
MQMQDWARAFPRPRYSRVMKPRSAGNSPSSITRRRTTVAQSGMQGVPNQYQSSLEAALLASASRNPRPISWHPSSARTRGLSNSTYVPDYTQDSYVDMNTIPSQPLDVNALSVYGSESMLSYPMDTTLSPDSYIPFYLDTHDAMPLQHTIPNSQVESMAWDTASNHIDMSTMSQTTSDGWSLDMLSMANIPPAETTCPSYASVPSPGELSGPSTPDFLPIQQFDSPASVQEKKQGKPEEELVGMGLYSQPDGSMSQSQQGILGKGLKLEETFSPSDDEKDDGSEDEDDDVNELEPVPQQIIPQQPAPMPQQNVSMPRQYAQPALNLLHKSFFFDHDDMDQQTMPSAPFASLNQSCMSYGYGWI